MNPCLKKSFVQPNAPKYYELAPRNELNDRSQAVILEGQVRVKISVYWGIFFHFDQVFDRYCNGISGALVEVWYAGGQLGCEEYFTLNS